MKRLAAAAIGLAALFGFLAIPAAEPPVAPAPARGAPFAWNRDAFWQALEARYAAVRDAGCDAAARDAATDLDRLAAILDTASARALDPATPTLDSLEAGFLGLGPVVAACPVHLRDYVGLYGRMREVVKWQSRSWDVAAAPARDRLYRALYGGRAAVEEAMLHHRDSIAPLLRGAAVPAATPAAVVHGVTVHSGDILVSRGGAPTSALIARGSDYPGNFSHVGLVHVDTAGAVSVIEAHIENGVAVATAERYLGDKKLRVMVLRLHPDLPPIAADPLLPHRAATLALERARSGHVAYDFAMDYQDPTRLFCSEVASSVYRELGVTLWTGLSTITAPGLRGWLAGFGVQHFETQEPSDLEYDPQLAVVAEWRDPEWLFQDHLDNAVLDAMLERAEAGESLDFAWYALPFARLAKGYSVAREQFGLTGPIPEGMSAASALRHRAFSLRQREIAHRVGVEALTVARERGYPPPYWVLLDLARAAAAGRPL